MLRMLVFAVALLLGTAAHAANTAHDFNFTSLEGEPLPMSQFEGQPVLLVNTASFCGFTYQYKALQALWDRYRDQGLVVLGVPSQDFGGQEYGSDGEIKQFCELTYGIEFPMTSLERVKGKGAHPLYRWIAAEMGKTRGVPRWNFHKFLLSPDGQVVGSWPSRVEPGSEEISAEIEALLATQ